MKLGDLGEVVVVGEELRVERAGQLHELGIDLLFVGEIQFVNLHFDARVVADAFEQFEAATTALAAHRVGGVGDELKFVQHELGHHDDALDEASFDQFRDASVDDDAGVEHDVVLGLALGFEADIGNDEGEILLVPAHGQHHAQVAEGEEQREADDPARLGVRAIDEHLVLIDERGDQCSEQQPEGGGGEGAQGKSLEHVVDADEQSAESKTDHQAIGAAVDDLRPALAHGVARPRAKEEKENADDPE